MSMNTLCELARNSVEKFPSKIAFSMFEGEEMTYAEAARVMGKKSKQVDNLLYRAKRELQSILGEEGMELL